MKKFTQDELQAVFRSYTLDGEIGLAVNPDPTMENRLAAISMQMILNGLRDALRPFLLR